MSATTLYGLLASGLVGLGLFVLIIHPTALTRLIGFNIAGAGIFLIFGVAGKRGAAAGLAADPIPQALVITGIVVAFAASALAVALMLRLARADDGGEDGAS